MTMPTKKYVVMVDYHTEGWSIQAETDDFDEAVKMREEAAITCCARAILFKVVETTVTEKP